jgi:hypothetical protein
MPASTQNLEWLNHNEVRAYPLTEDADGVDLSAAFKLPTDFLVAVHLPIALALNVKPDQFYVRRILSTPTGFAVVVAYNSDSGPIDAATATISRIDYVRGKTFPLVGAGDFADSIGRVALGRLENLDLQPAGLFEFSFDSGRLEPDCIRPMLRGVSAIYVSNAGDTSVPLYNDVELEAGSNTRLTTTIVAGQRPKIRIDFIDGEGSVEACPCVDETIGPPIRTIDGVGPNDDGNLDLLGDACIEVEPASFAINLKDTCSKPCCGCRELEVVTQALDQLRNNVAAYENLQTRLASSVQAMDMVVLGSRLGDRGACAAC